MSVQSREFLDWQASMKSLSEDLKDLLVVPEYLVPCGAQTQ